MAARLPKPLATLFEKLSVFARHYPAFDIRIKIKGATSLTINDPNAAASSDDDEIDKLY